MSKLNELKEQITEHLRFSDGFEDAELLTAYPGREMPYPLSRPAVAVGIGGVELAPAGFGGYLGEREREAVFGGKAEITLRFDLFSPMKQEAGRIQELYEALCEALVTGENPFGLTKLVLGEVSFDPGSAANRAAARGSLTVALPRGKGEERFSSAEVVTGDDLFA